MKRLIKAILWIGCYGGIGWLALKIVLGFDILSQKHWIMLFDRSVHETWPIQMADKKLVCKVLLGFILVGILGLVIVTKKKKEYHVISKAELPRQENYRPVPMASQGRIAAPAPVQAPNNGGFNAPGVVPVPPAAGTNTSYVSSMSEAIKRISDVAKTFEASIFPHVKLENTFTHLVISDDTNALLLKILPQSGTWHVEPNQDPKESVWTLDGQNPQNTLKDIINSTQTLTRLEPDANSFSVVVLANGTLEKPEEVKEFLTNNGIRIATLLPDNKTIPGIQTWQELLAEFYPPKTKEDENETNNNPQNL